MLIVTYIYQAGITLVCVVCCGVSSRCPSSHATILSHLLQLLYYIFNCPPSHPFYLLLLSQYPCLIHWFIKFLGRVLHSLVPPLHYCVDESCVSHKACRSTNCLHGPDPYASNADHIDETQCRNMIDQ
jgi:hypothetical protein